MSQPTFSRKERIGLYFVAALIITMISSIGIAMTAMTTDVFGSKGSNKGLKVDLFIDNRQGAQQGVIETYQHDYVVQTDYQYLIGDRDGGYNGITLHYPRGAVETGPFMICVTLERDNLESCANGHNHEEKQPELVEIYFGPEYRYPDQSSSPSSAASSSNSNSESESSATQSQSQSTTIINCPADSTCRIEQ